MDSYTEVKRGSWVEVSIGGGWHLALVTYVDVDVLLVNAVVFVDHGMGPTTMSCHELPYVAEDPDEPDHTWREIRG